MLLTAIILSPPFTPIFTFLTFPLQTGGSCGTANKGKGFANSDFELPLYMLGDRKWPNAQGGSLYDGETGLVGTLCTKRNNFQNCATIGDDRTPVYHYACNTYVYCNELIHYRYAFQGSSPRGMVQSPATFYKWFHDTNESKSIPYTLTMNNVGNQARTYTYSNDAFFPLDGKGWKDYNKGMK